MVLNNKQIKLINSLHSKKGRLENQLFLVEGEKAIFELLHSSFKINFLLINEVHQSNAILQNIVTPLYLVSESDLCKYSTLVSNNFGVAIVEMPLSSIDFVPKPLTIVLDGIRDPGNLGTIIRICDWYGFSQLILSNDCTEFYNPKVISASMGSFLRINHIYVDLETYLRQYPNVPKIGALLDGENVHSYNFPESGFIIFGNESNGIRNSIVDLIDDRVTIPSYGSAESLNVSISCAIFLDNLRRR
jgi:TrmH family RNA methyltransferase